MTTGSLLRYAADACEWSEAAVSTPERCCAERCCVQKLRYPVYLVLEFLPTDLKHYQDSLSRGRLPPRLITK